MCSPGGFNDEECMHSALFEIDVGDIMESPGPDVCGRIIMAKASAEPVMERLSRQH